MKIAHTFRHLDSSDSLKQYAHDKLAKLEKLLHGPAEAEVTYSVEGRLHLVDVHLMAGSENFRASESSEDMYASIDNCIDKVRSQVTSARGGHQAQRRRPGIGEVAAAQMAAPSEAPTE